MQLWRSILAYDGTPFHGWQVQPGLLTVQGTLSAALHHLTGETVLPQGSGRTDTGVHALAQVASFPLAASIPPANLLRALNRALPPSIRILSVDHAAPGFHARHSARRKTYEYRIFPRLNPSGPEHICPPSLAPYVFDLPHAFDLLRAQAAASHILGEHDFTSFAAVDPDRATRILGPDSQAPRSHIRSIDHSAWHLESLPQILPGQPPGSCAVYRVTGSGFLHHMVRNLVGTFLQAAAGRLDPDAIPKILAAQNRSAAGPTAPARGLFLHNVEY